MKRIIAAALLTACTVGCGGAQAQTTEDTDFFVGACGPTSHTAEGPIGSDLTKRQSRFYCNSLVETGYANANHHMMFQFTEKEAHHAQILGFAGVMDKDGILMRVDRIYLEPGHPTPVDEGYCRFFFKGHTFTAVVCGAKVDEDGRRTTAVVAFDVAPGQ